MLDERWGDSLQNKPQNTVWHTRYLYRQILMLHRAAETPQYSMYTYSNQDYVRLNHARAYYVPLYRDGEQFPCSSLPLLMAT